MAPFFMTEKMLFPDDIDIAGQGTKEIPDLGRFGHGHDPEAVHHRLQGLQGVHFRR